MTHYQLLVPWTQHAFRGSHSSHNGMLASQQPASICQCIAIPFTSSPEVKHRDVLCFINAKYLRTFIDNIVQYQLKQKIIVQCMRMLEEVVLHNDLNCYIISLALSISVFVSCIQQILSKKIKL